MNLKLLLMSFTLLVQCQYSTSACSTIDHCLDCFSPSVCTSCEDFYGVNANQTCSECNYAGHCSYCYSNVSQCEYCIPGYAPNSNGDGSCSEKPPCALVENCQICDTPPKCDKCKDGYDPGPASESCLLAATSAAVIPVTNGSTSAVEVPSTIFTTDFTTGFSNVYQSPTTIDLTCLTIDYCLECTNPSVCTTCEDYYGLNLNRTCSECNYAGHCVYCYQNVSHCEACSPGYQPNSNGDGSCHESSPCTAVENCQICDTPPKCDKCKDGYDPGFSSESCLPNPSVTMTKAVATGVNAATTQVVSTIAATTTVVASTFTTTPSTIAASTIQVSSTTTSIIFLTTTSFTMTVPSTIADFTTTVSSPIAYSTIEVSSTSTITVASTIVTSTTTVASTIVTSTTTIASTIATSTATVASTIATSTVKVSYTVVSTILSTIILASTTTAKQNVTVTQLPPGVNIPVLVGSVIGVIMGVATIVVLLCVFINSSPLNRPYTFG